MAGSDTHGKETLQGEIERVTYHSEDSLYTVIKILPESGYAEGATLLEGAPRRVGAVGRAPRPAEGLRVCLTGRWGSHPVHGRQFEFESLTVLTPISNAGLVRYLSSSAFPGVGEVLAKRIVENLGSDALAIIRDHPEQLSGVPGLRDSVRSDLVEAVGSEIGAQELHAFLLGVGLGPWQAQAVAEALGPDAETRVRQNPYLLARAVSGIGFHIADRVARSLGCETDSIERYCAAEMHVLGEASNDGHSLLPEGELHRLAEELLRTDPGRDELEEALAELDHREEVVVEPDPESDEARVYLPMLHTSEVGLTRSILRLLSAGSAPPLASEAQLISAEGHSGLTLHPLQREAVLGLLAQPVALLTGGPGVGKTTIIRLVVELARSAGARVLLASPTGRAAKRLAEATGHEAKTIHRLLGFEPRTGGFRHGRDQPLEADLLVVDEISMLDVILGHHLAKAIQAPTRVVLVGDPDQLPSVAAGNVLSDLLESGRIPAFRLTQIFRQDEGSMIVQNAHRILRGEMPEAPSESSSDPAAVSGDFYHFVTEGEEETAARLVEVVTQRIPERFGREWVRDVQVLSPMYRGACGVDALNARLQDELGMEGRELEHRGVRWRTGDRVIHVRNDYEKDVFNGDMGRIEQIDADGKGITVRYPERSVRYERNELRDLQPAFAITVHRSQGGEFPVVVIPLVTQHFVMLQRHLLYTAITRARELVVLVGSNRALRLALDNAEQRLRRSALSARLRQAHP